MASRQDSTYIGMDNPRKDRKVRPKTAENWPTGTQEHTRKNPCSRHWRIGKDQIRKSSSRRRNQEILLRNGGARLRRTPRNRLRRSRHRLPQQCPLLASGETMSHFVIFLLFSKPRVMSDNKIIFFKHMTNDVLIYLCFRNQNFSPKMDCQRHHSQMVGRENPGYMRLGSQGEGFLVHPLTPSK